MSEQLKHVLICIDQQGQRTLDEISTELSQAGMQIIDVMKMSGIIAGTVAESKIPEMELIEGVVSVDEDLEFEV